MSANASQSQLLWINQSRKYRKDAEWEPLRPRILELCDQGKSAPEIVELLHDGGVIYDPPLTAAEVGRVLRKWGKKRRLFEIQRLFMYKTILERERLGKRPPVFRFKGTNDIIGDKKVQSSLSRHLKKDLSLRSPKSIISVGSNDCGISVVTTTSSHESKLQAVPWLLRPNLRVSSEASQGSSSMESSKIDNAWSTFQPNHFFDESSILNQPGTSSRWDSLKLRFDEEWSKPHTGDREFDHSADVIDLEYELALDKTPKALSETSGPTDIVLDDFAKSFNDVEAFISNQKLVASTRGLTSIYDAPTLDDIGLYKAQQDTRLMESTESMRDALIYICNKVNGYYTSEIITNLKIESSTPLTVEDLPRIVSSIWRDLLTYSKAHQTTPTENLFFGIKDYLEWFIACNEAFGLDQKTFWHHKKETDIGHFREEIFETLSVDDSTNALLSKSTEGPTNFDSSTLQVFWHPVDFSSSEEQWSISQREFVFPDVIQVYIAIQIGFGHAVRELNYNFDIDKTELMARDELQSKDFEEDMMDIGFEL